jgi:hypothetical protein
MPDSPSFQQRLAFYLVVIGSGVVGILAAVAIVCASFGSATNSGQTAKDILAIILPVIGTWIGTVLAFYFGKENFKAAAEETRALLGQRLSKPAINYAKELADFEKSSIIVPDRAAALALKLDDINKKLADLGFYRIPVLTSDKAPLFVIHRQPLDSFTAAQCRAGNAAAANTVTLQDLLNDPTEGPRIQNSFALIPESATLADAKAAMATRSPCQDVFITKNGRDGEPTIAWLNNNDIQQAATA